MAYHKILIPLDGSPLAEEAVNQVNHVAAPGAAIHLLSVLSIEHLVGVGVFANAGGLALQSIDPSLSSPMENSDIGESKTRQAYLNNISQRLTEVGYHVTAQVKALEVISDAIVDIAHSGGYDLVIMATHGRSGLSRLVIGSVTQAVLANAPCPVLVVSPDHFAHRATH